MSSVRLYPRLFFGATWGTLYDQRLKNHVISHLSDDWTKEGEFSKNSRDTGDQLRTIFWSRAAGISKRIAWGAGTAEMLHALSATLGHYVSNAISRILEGMEPIQWAQYTNAGLAKKSEIIYWNWYWLAFGHSSQSWCQWMLHWMQIY